MQVTQRVRLAHGMRWNGPRPSLADYQDATRWTWRTVVAVLIVLCAWGWAMNADYQEQLVAERMRAERIEREFTECQRGNWRAVTVQGDEIGCMPLEMVKKS